MWRGTGGGEDDCMTLSSIVTVIRELIQALEERDYSRQSIIHISFSLMLLIYCL